jgi:hypothetical protein
MLNYLDPLDLMDVDFSMLFNNFGQFLNNFLNNFHSYSGFAVNCSACWNKIQGQYLTVRTVSREHLIIFNPIGTNVPLLVVQEDEFCEWYSIGSWQSIQTDVAESVGFDQS